MVVKVGISALGNISHKYPKSHIANVATLMVREHVHVINWLGTLLFCFKV